MEFVSIDGVLTSIVRATNDLDPRDRNDPWSALADVERVAWSQAASRLYQALHHAGDDGLCWYFTDRKKMHTPLRNDAVRTEGMAVIGHVAEWFQRVQDAVRASRAVDGSADASHGMRGVLDVYSGKYGGKFELAAWRIGFEREELAAFLDAHAIQHDLRAHVVQGSNVEAAATSIALNSDRIETGPSSGAAVPADFTRASEMQVDQQADLAPPAESADAEHHDAAVAVSPGSTPAQTVQSLTTGEIAFVFHGIHFEDWTRNLQDVSTGSWLESCRISKGTKGSRGTQARWDPLEIAKKLATSNRLRGKQSKNRRRELLQQKFKAEKLLKPWKSAWDDITVVMFDDA